MTDHPYGPVAYVHARGTWTPMTTCDPPDAEKSDILRWLSHGQPLLNADGSLLIQEGPPMEAHDVQRILAKCAAFDNRNPDPMAVAAWAEALDRDVTVQDALAAVSVYYANTRQWIMPSDVNAACRAMRARRISDEIERKGALLPDGLGDNPAAEARWRKASLHALGQGATREQASEYAWCVIGMTPPPIAITEHHTVSIDQIGAAS